MSNPISLLLNYYVYSNLVFLILLILLGIKGIKKYKIW